MPMVPLSRGPDSGFGNYLMPLGVIETVALFVLVFSMMGLA